MEEELTDLDPITGLPYKPITIDLNEGAAMRNSSIESAYFTDYGDIFGDHSRFDWNITADEIHAPGGIEKHRGDEQTLIEQFVKSDIRNMTTPTLKLAQQLAHIGSVIPALYRLYNGEKNPFKVVYDNALVNSLYDAEKSLKEAIPIYGGSRYNDGSLLKKLTSSKMLFDDMQDGVAFAVSAIPVGMATGGVGTALSKLPWVGKVAQIIGGGLAQTIGESGAEAKGILEQSQNIYSDRLYNSNYTDLNPDQKRIVDDKSYTEADRGLRDNMTLLLASNMLESALMYGKIGLNPIKAEAMAMNKELSVAVGKAWKPVVTKTLLGMVSEGFLEEGMQTAIQRNSELIAKGEKEDPGIGVEGLMNEIPQVMNEWLKGYKELDDEQLYSAAMGMLIGGPMSGATAHNDWKADKDVIEKAYKRYQLNQENALREGQKSADILSEMARVSQSNAENREDRLHELKNELFAIHSTTLANDVSFSKGLNTQAFDNIVKQYEDISKLDNKTPINEAYKKQLEQLTTQLDMIPSNEELDMIDNKEQAEQLKNERKSIANEMNKLSKAIVETEGLTDAQIAGFAKDKNDNAYVEQSAKYVSYLKDIRNQFEKIYEKNSSEQDIELNVPGEILKHYINKLKDSDNVTHYQDKIDKLKEEKISSQKPKFQKLETEIVSYESKYNALKETGSKTKEVRDELKSIKSTIKALRKEREYERGNYTEFTRDEYTDKEFLKNVDNLNKELAKSFVSQLYNDNKYSYYKTEKGKKQLLKGLYLRKQLSELSKKADNDVITENAKDIKQAAQTVINKQTETETKEAVNSFALTPQIMSKEKLEKQGITFDDEDEDEVFGNNLEEDFKPKDFTEEEIEKGTKLTENKTYEELEKEDPKIKDKLKEDQKSLEQLEKKKQLTKEQRKYLSNIRKLNYIEETEAKKKSLNSALITINEISQINSKLEEIKDSDITPNRKQFLLDESINKLNKIKSELDSKPLSKEEVKLLNELLETNKIRNNNLRAIIELEKSNAVALERNSVRILEVDSFDSKRRVESRKNRLNFDSKRHKIMFKITKGGTKVSKVTVFAGDHFDNKVNPYVVLESDITLEIYNESTAEFLGQIKRPGRYYVEDKNSNDLINEGKNYRFLDPFNIDDLKIYSPTFVFTDEQGNSVMTEEGLNFLENYKSLNSALNNVAKLNELEYNSDTFEKIFNVNTVLDWDFRDKSSVAISAKESIGKNLDYILIDLNNRSKPNIFILSKEGDKLVSRKPTDNEEISLRSIVSQKVSELGENKTGYYLISGENFNIDQLNYSNLKNNDILTDFTSIIEKVKEANALLKQSDNEKQYEKTLKDLLNEFNKYFFALVDTVGSVNVELKLNTKQENKTLGFTLVRDRNKLLQISLGLDEIINAKSIQNLINKLNKKLAREVNRKDIDLPFKFSRIIERTGTLDVKTSKGISAEDFKPDPDNFVIVGTNDQKIRLTSKDEPFIDTPSEITSDNEQTEEIIISDEEKLANDLANLGDAMFSIKNNPRKTTSFDRALSNLNRILNVNTPGGINVTELNEAMDKVYREGKISFGSFVNNIITLGRNIARGTEYHEAFHAIFRSYLDDNSIIKAYKIAKSVFRKPTRADLQKLIDTSESYRNLSINDLTLIYYEERMAEDFRSYMTSFKETPLKWIYDRLIRLVRTIMNSDYSQMNLLFNDISSGEFKNAKQQFNVFSKVQETRSVLYSATTIVDTSGNPKTVAIALPTHTSNNIISRIVRNVILNDSKQDFQKVTEDDIIEKIKYYLNNFYSDKNWEAEIEQDTKNNLGRSPLKEKLSRIRIALIADLKKYETLGKSKIVDEVKKKIVILKTKSLDETTSEEDLEDMGSESLAIKESSEIGGVDSLSKRMKVYLSFITRKQDEFGIGLTEEQLQADGKYDVPLDIFQTHFALERVLKETPKNLMLKKLEIISKDNPNLAAFYAQIKKDTGYNGKLTKTVKDSPLYNTFISQYYKIESNTKAVLYDYKKGISLTVDANRQSAKHTQVSSWNDNFLSLVHKGLTKDNLKLRIQKILESFGKLDISNLEEGSIDKYVSNIQSLFSSIGVNLSKGYIKISLIKERNYTQTFIDALQNSSNIVIENNKKYLVIRNLYTNDVIFKAEAEYVESLIELSLSFDNIEAINELDKLKIILDEITKSGEDVGQFNPFNRNDTIDNSANVVTIWRKIAEANSNFDETVVSSSYKNPEGKSIYNIQFPNYLTETSVSYRNIRKLSILRENINDSKVLQEFKELYDIDNDFIAIETFQFLKDNPIINDNDANVIFENFRIDSVAGITNTNLKQTKEGTTVRDTSRFSDDAATSYGHADTRTKLLNNIILYFDKKEKTRIGKFLSGKKEKVSFVNVVLGVNADKNTSYITLAKEYDLYKEGKLTEEGVNKFYKLLLQEYDRIGRVVDYKDRTDRPIIEGYLDVKKGTPRGLQLTNFRMTQVKIGNKSAVEFIEELAKNKKVITPEIEAKIKAALSEWMQLRLSEYINTLKNEGLVESSVKIEDKTLIPNRMLPSNVWIKIKNKQYVDTDKLGNMFMNSTYSAQAYNQLFKGDKALSVKDDIDETKRNASNLAAGPSFNEDVTVQYASLDKTYVRPGLISKKIKADIELYTNVDALGHRYISKEKIEYSVNEGKLSRKDADNILSAAAVDSTDAESYGTFKLQMNYLKSIGKYGNEVKFIYSKIKRGINLSREEVDILKNNNAMNSDRKLVYRDMYHYNKLSTHFLTRYNVSSPVKGLSSSYIDSVYTHLEDLEYQLEEGLISQKDVTKFYDSMVSPMWEAIPGREALHNTLNSLERDNIDMLIMDSAAKMAKYNIVNLSNSGIFSTKPIKTFGKYWREQVSTDGRKQKIVDGTQAMALIFSEQNPTTKVKFKGRETTIGEVREMYIELLHRRVLEGYSHKLHEIEIDGVIDYRKFYDSIKNGLEKENADQVLLEIFTLDSTGKPMFNLNLPQAIFKAESLFNSFISEGTLKHKSPGMKLTLVSDYGYNVVFDSKINRVLRIDELKDLSFSKMFEEQHEGKPRYIKRRLQHALRDENGLYFSECIIPKKVAESFNLRKGDIIPEHIAKMFGVRIPTQDKHSMINLKVVDFIGAEHDNSIIMPYETVFLAGEDFDIDSKYVKIFDYVKLGKRTIIFGDYLNKRNLNDAAEEAAVEWLQNEMKYNKDLYAIFKKYKTDIENTSLEEALSLGIHKDSKWVKDRVNLIIDNYSQIEDEDTIIDTEDDIDFLREITLKYQWKALGEYLNKSENNAKLDVTVSLIDTVKKNKRLFEEGKLSKIVPLTKGEINNLMLYADIALSRNEGNENIADTPANMTIFKELFVKWQRELGLKEPNKIMGAYSPDDMSKMQRSVDIGKDNIPPSALFNSLYQVLKRASLELNPSNKTLKPILGIFNKFKEENSSYVNNSNESIIVRINDIISSFISSATDNAKEQDAVKFNLSQDNLGLALTMIGMGVNAETTLKFMQTPIMKSFVRLSDLSSSKTKHASEFSKRKKEIFDNIRKEFGLVKIKPVQLDNINIDKILNDIIVKDNENDNFKWVSTPEMKSIFEGIIQEMEKVSEYYEQLQKISTLMSLTKGTKATFAENEKFFIAMKGLGIIVNKISDSTNIDERYEISYDPDIIKDLPFNTKTIIDASRILQINIKALTDIRRVSSKMFISQTKLGRNIFDRIINLAKEDSFIFKDNIMKFNKDLLSYIGMKTNEYLNKEYTNTDIIFNSNLSDIIDYIKKLDEFKYNAFVKYIQAVPVKKEFGTYEGKTIHKIVLTIETKDNPNVMERLLDGFTELFNHSNSIITIDNIEYTGPKIAKLLYDYLKVKDNMQFKRDSFVKQIRPYVLSKFSQALGVAQNTLNDSTVTALGIDNKEAEEEFLELFFRFSENYNILYNNNFRDTVEDKSSGRKYKINEEVPSIFTKNKNEFVVDINNGLSEADDQNLPTLTQLNYQQYEDFIYDNDNFKLGLDKSILAPFMFRQENNIYKKVETIRDEGGIITSVKYIQVSRIGDKDVSPYAISLSEHNKINEEVQNYKNEKEQNKNEDLAYRMGITVPSKHEGYNEDQYNDYQEDTEELEDRFLQSAPVNVSKVSDNKVEKGENISSKGSKFAKQLTNPGNNLKVTYKEKEFKNAEHAYQTWKSGKFDEVAYKKGVNVNTDSPMPPQLRNANIKANFSSSYQTMADILTAKLQQHPQLVEGINERGGIEYLNNSKHEVIGDNFWEKQGNFIKALKEAYNNVKNTKKTIPTTSEVIESNTALKYDIKNRSLLKDNVLNLYHEDFKANTELFSKYVDIDILNDFIGKALDNKVYIQDVVGFLNIISQINTNDKLGKYAFNTLNGYASFNLRLNYNQYKQYLDSNSILNNTLNESQFSKMSADDLRNHLWQLTNC